MRRHSEQIVHSIGVINGAVGRLLLLGELALLRPARGIPIRDTSLDALLTPFRKEQAFALVPLGALVAFERDCEGLRAFLDRTYPCLCLREVIWNLLGLRRSIWGTKKSGSS